jgi:hypothetical protein
MSWPRFPLLLFLLSSCTSSTDQDKDGFGVLQGDCDDHDDTIHPAAPEVCNGIDDDCDGNVDDEAAGGDWFYPDGDSDGYGQTAFPAQHCAESVPLWARERGDCDDGDPAIHPGADELCNGIDEDCDGRIDEGSVDAATWYADDDGDGWGDDAQTWPACSQPSGWVAEGGDCDDGDPSVHPGAEEFCWTEGDDDCDGLINDPEAADCQDWYEDADGDGYGGAGACLCEPEEPYTLDSSEDCDDSDAAVHPGAVEVDDWVDDDCDGRVEYPVSSFDVVLYGEDELDVASTSLAAVGDVDGDGWEDIMVGAWGDDNNGSASGSVYLVRGPVTASMALADAHAQLEGAAYADKAGYAVAGAGDQDGDGLPDLAIGAMNLDEGATDAGGVYVISGTVSGVVPLAEEAVLIWGTEASGGVGQNLDGGHDLTGDGQADLVMGSPYSDIEATNGGAVWVIEGPVTASASVDDAFTTLCGAYGELVGTAVAIGGDMNGDGVRELYVGAPEADLEHTNTGSLLVYQGPLDPGYPEPDAQLHGETDYDRLGYWVADGGDVDGDGFDDLLAGSIYADFIRYNGGVVYVIPGPVWGRVPVGEALAARIVGAEVSDETHVIEGAGDVDGDGFDDVVIGARYHDGELSEDQGGAWLLFGPVSGNIDLATDADIAFVAQEETEALGTTVNRGGDLDGDGLEDLLLGSRYWGDPNVGGVYVAYGRER